MFVIVLTSLRLRLWMGNILIGRREGEGGEQQVLTTTRQTMTVQQG